MGNERRPCSWVIFRVARDEAGKISMPAGDLGGSDKLCIFTIHSKEFMANKILKINQSTNKTYK